MSLQDLIGRLATLEISVELVGDKLRLSGPEEALTPELHAELRARRDELVAHLGGGPRSNAALRLVPLQSLGRSAPFFGVPGHNGDVFCFRPLSAELGGAQRLYAFQPPGVDGKEAPLESVQALGAALVAGIRDVAPEGPYRLGGYCTGGVIAYEAAQQLLAQGSEIASLVLFGTPSIAGYQLSNRLKAKPVRAVAKAIRMVRGEKPAGERAPAPEMTDADREKVERATLAAVRIYEPTPYAGRITLFIPSSDRAALYVERYMEWKPLALGGFTVHPGLEGTIHSRMLRPPAVEALAPLLLAELER